MQYLQEFACDVAALLKAEAMRTLVIVLMSFGAPWQAYVQGDYNLDELVYSITADRVLREERKQIKESGRRVVVDIHVEIAIR